MTLPTVPIPAAGYEEHFWHVPRDGRYSRSVASKGTGTYRSAVPAKIANLELALPGELAGRVDEATERLATFNQHALVRLGSDAATLGPMSSVLLRTESTSSSQIENLTVGAKQLALAQVGNSSSANAALVTGNVRAMEAALNINEGINTATIQLLHQRLMEDVPGWEDSAGKFREELVWVGSSAASPLGASHVAPQHDLIQEAIDDLTEFVARDDLPVLVQAAITHAQFENIHPFTDGNGRTGRALIHVILRMKGLLRNTTAPISAGLLRETEGYFRALTSYREGDAAPIIAAFADAAWFAAQSGMELIDRLARLADEARENLRGFRSDANVWKVVPLLISHPALTVPALSQLTGLTPQSAVRTLGQLADADVLAERTGHRRNRVWIHEGILQVLDDYADQLRR